MKHNKSVLCLAILPLFSSSFATAESEFFSQSTLGFEGKAQTYNYNMAKASDFDETPYTAKMKFKSGYHNGWLGLDMTGGIKGMVKEFSEQVNGVYVGKNTAPDGKTIGIVPTLYIKTKFDVAGDTLRVGYGKKARKTNILVDKFIRIDNSKYVGLDASYESDKFDLFSSYLTQFQDTDATSFASDIVSFNGEKIDYDASLGFKAKSKLYTLKAEYQNVDKFIQRGYFAAGYKFGSINTDIRLNWFGQFGAGDNLENDIFDFSDSNAGYFGVTSFTRIGDSGQFILSATQNYGGDLVQFSGKPNTSGRVKSNYEYMSLIESSSMFEDERSYTFAYRQNLGDIGLDGLYVWAQFTYSDNATGFTGDYFRKDYGLYVSQDLSVFSPHLKGLSLTYYAEDQRVGGTNIVARRMNANIFHMEMLIQKFTLIYKF